MLQMLRGRQLLRRFTRVDVKVVMVMVDSERWLRWWCLGEVRRRGQRSGAGSSWRNAVAASVGDGGVVDLIVGVITGGRARTARLQIRVWWRRPDMTLLAERLVFFDLHLCLDPVTLFDVRGRHVAGSRTDHFSLGRDDIADSFSDHLLSCLVHGSLLLLDILGQE